MAELDSLQINVTASTSGAISSIDKLIIKLNNLGQAIGTVNSKGFATSMENMVGALNEIKAVSDGLNSAANLRIVADGIRSLSNATRGMSDGSTARMFLQNVSQGMASLEGLTATDYSGVSAFFDSVRRMGSGGVVNASVALPQIATALRQFQGITLPDFSGMESFATFLRSLGSKTIVNASTALQPIVNALREFQTLNIGNIQGISELAQSLSLFGRATTQRAITLIPQVATAFRELIATLATAPAVSRNVVSLANALAQFVTNINRVGSGATNATTGLKMFGATAGSVSKKTFSLASAIGKLYATYFLFFRAFRLFKKSIDIASDLKEVQNVVDTTFGTMTDKVEEFTKTSIEGFGLSELSAKRFSSRFQAMGVAMGITGSSVEKAQQQLNKINPELNKRGYNDLANSMADVSLNLTKLTADISSFYNVAQEDVAKDLESVFTGSTRPLRAYGLDITNATLQEWALKNGIDAKVKSMSQAEKTLLRYQYVLANTSAAQGDFAKTSITWANQIRILGQNFERLGRVIGEGLIAWLRPAVVTINKYMDSIIAAVQKVINALGQIFGWQMIVDSSGAVADAIDDVADSYEDAAGSAKKFKQQLLGIDELNNLTTKDNGGGGGDLGGGLYGGTNIIQPSGISFAPYESEIKNLYDLGKKLSDGLKNLLPDSWEEIYEKARSFGSGFAQFLNGLIQPETFYKIGQSIAGILNTIKNAIVAFFTDADWEQYREAFVAGLKGFLDEIDISTVGLIIGAITIKKVGAVLFSSGALKAIAGAIGKFLSSGGLATAISSIGVSGAIAAGAVAALATGLGITYANNEEVRNGFAESSNTLLNSFVPALQFISETLIPDIKNGFQGLLGVIQPLVDYVSTVFTSLWLDFINPVIQKFGEEIIPKVTSTLTDLWTKVLVPLGNLVGSVLSPVFEYWGSVLTSLWQKAIVPIAQAIGSLWLTEFDVVITMVKELIEFFGNLIKVINLLWEASLKPLVEAIINTVKPVFDDVFSFIGNIVTSTIGVFKNFIDFIMGVFTGDWERAWGGIKGIFANIFNGIISILEFAVNVVIDGINGLLNGINWATSGLSELTGKDLKIQTIQKLELPRFESGGFPDQGSLFVAGETYGQSEWIGNINGRTGVTSGAEITGIADAIYSTSAQEMEILREQNNYLMGILQKEFGITENQIGKASRSYARDYYDRTGKQAYSF